MPSAPSTAPLRTLAESPELLQAFPGQAFEALPALSEPAEKMFPDLYRQALAQLQPRQAVIVAVPDQFHHEFVMAALNHEQHVLCVKPLVLQYQHAHQIEQLASQKGLYVGVEYHKRFDRRSLMAKRHYALGQFGEFIMGEAKLIEPYYYRHSNFQNWFTCDKTDPFVYVGCHYVDLVYFITGLRPTALSVSGVKGRFPNGNEGYLWANARVRYANGALLSVTAGLGYPNDAAGSNDQGLLMYCEGSDASGMIQHIDNERGVRYSYLEAPSPYPLPPGGEGMKKGACGGTKYNHVSPDFYRIVPWEGPGFKPVGYGYDSIAANLETMSRIEAEVATLAPGPALAQRRQMIAAIDRQGILATPANSFINELVVEAARLSIQGDGRWVQIAYEPSPHVSVSAEKD